MGTKAQRTENIAQIVTRKEVKMEKDKLQLIKTIITLVDTEEGLKQIRDTVTKVLQTQWNKEEEDKKEFEQWRKEKNEIDLPL